MAITRRNSKYKHINKATNATIIIKSKKMFRKVILLSVPRKRKCCKTAEK